MNKIMKATQLLKNGQSELVLNKLRKKLGFREVLHNFPLYLMIEPTNFCNLHCPICPTGSGKMKRQKRMMSFLEFKSIIDQSKGHVTNIALWNYGEPFLNRELLEMIKYAVSAGIRVRTSTNGELFKTKEFCLEVVKSGLQNLIICLDGADQETIKIYRKGASFSEIENGIRLIQEAKKTLASKTPIIELQFILMKHNVQQKDHMKQIAKELGVEIYSEKTVGIDINDPDFQKLAKEFVPNDSSLSRYYLKEDGTFALKGKIHNGCSVINREVVINSDGNVVPCSYDLYSEYVMGNVFEESLETIWKNDKYQSFRSQIRKDRKSIPMCNTCSEGRTNIGLS